MKSLEKVASQGESPIGQAPAAEGQDEGAGGAAASVARG